MTEAAQTGADIETIICASRVLRSSVARDVIEAAAARGTRCIDVAPDVLTSVATREHPQGIVAVVRQRWTSPEEIRWGPDALWVALDRIQDPGNLGTILRSADAFGASGVILVDATADPFDPASVRASMGSILAVRIARASTRQLLDGKRSRRWHLVGASGAAKSSFRDVEYPRPLILLMGSEREGLSADQEEGCDTLVRIPMAGRADSLNVSVAAGILLAEISSRSQ